MVAKEPWGNTRARVPKTLPSGHDWCWIISGSAEPGAVRRPP